MASPSDWFPLFMTAMGVGCLASLMFTPVIETGAGFHKFNTGVVLVLLTLAAAFLPSSAWQLRRLDWTDWGPSGWADYAGGEISDLGFGITLLVLLGLTVLSYVSTYVGGGRMIRRTESLGVLVGILFVTVETIAQLITAQRLHSSTAYLAIASVVFSTILLGSTITGMLVGHAYLRNPGMPFATLQRMARVYAWALGARFALYLLAFFLVYVPLWQASPYSTEMLLEQHLPFQLLRVLAGFILSAPLAYMILKCADLRSNQSATGILYVAVVFALIGELVGFYYFGQTGVPL